MKRFRSLSADNEFHFSCPVFQTEVKLYDCFQLDDTVKRGQPIPERGGCRAMMICGKCPINFLVKEMVRNPDIDLFSAEHKVGRLPENVIERLRPVMIQQSVVDRTPMTDEEREAINRAMTETKPSKDAPKVELAKPRAKRAATEDQPAPVAKVDDDVELRAAMTGDMSLALSRAASAPTPKPVEAPASQPTEAVAQPKVAAPAVTDAAVRPMSLLERARLAREATAP